MGPLFEILLVDDNPADVLLMKEALSGSRVLTRLHSALNGTESISFLRREEPFTDAPRPNLILLDVNMPGKGGLEVLAEIKSDASLRSIPVVMLSSSKDANDVARAYDLQANGYVQKPVDFDDFISVMGGIEQFWTDVVTLPNSVISPQGASMRPPASN